MNLQFIKHRCNAIQDLDGVNDLQWGVEIDLRANSERNGCLYLAHDAWSPGENFEIWVKEFKQKNIQGPIILNTKEDGLEQRILDILQAYEVKNYFFLDTAMPTLIKWTLKNNHSKFALRVSSYEPIIPTDFDNKVEWIWVDCFNGISLSKNMILPFKERNFKICLVSPELQGCSIETIKDFKELVTIADAVCTKNPQEWIRQYE